MRVFALHEIIGQCLPEYMHGAEQPCRPSAPSACIYFIKEERQMHSKSKPGFIRLNTLAFAAALALLPARLHCFSAAVSRKRKGKSLPRKVSYIIRILILIMQNAASSPAVIRINTQSILNQLPNMKSFYAQAVELVSAGKPNEARAIFIGITGYLNSADFVEYIDSLKVHYDSGVKLYEKRPLPRSIFKFCGCVRL